VTIRAFDGLLVAAVVTLIGTARVAAQQCGAPYFLIQERPSAVLAPSHVAATRAFDLPNLRSNALPDDWRELRLWLFPGILSAEFHVRIVEHAATICGELKQFWSTSGRRRPVLGVAKCQEVGHEESIEFCQLDSAEVRWGSVLAFLDSLGIDTIPDVAVWNASGLTADDDMTIAVEIVHGDSYRAYSFGHAEAWSTNRSHALELLKAIALVGRVLAAVERPFAIDPAWRSRLEHWLSGPGS
jgi:hypothetical protein